MSNQHNENEHPRGRDGKWVDKPGTGPATESDVALDAAAPSLRERLAKISADADIRAGEAEREFYRSINEAARLTLVSDMLEHADANPEVTYFSTIDYAEEMNDDGSFDCRLYEMYDADGESVGEIAPEVVRVFDTDLMDDLTEDGLLSVEKAREWAEQQVQREDNQAFDNHLTKITNEAGLETMKDIYETMSYRGNVNDEYFMNLIRLERVERDWQDYVAPAIDRMEDEAVADGYDW